MLEQFLVYLPDPFGVGSSRYAVADDAGLSLIDPSRLAELRCELITYDVAILIDDLRRIGARPPPSMIDMADAIRLSTGLSKSDGGEPKWNFWRKIKGQFDEQSQWADVRAMHESRTARTEHAQEVRLLRALANACIKLWAALKDELAKKGEFDRFFAIETHVAKIFHARQFDGIAVDRAQVKRLRDEASKEKYESYRAVADQLGVSPTGLNYWNVRRHLPVTEFEHLAEAVKGYTLRDQLKISTDVSRFACAFTEYMDASRDVDILTRLSNSPGRTYPTFHSIGTISSRILVSDPHLQELRRKFRGALAADSNHQLFYFDYSQFEPGIMASLAEDEQLIHIYNDGDIYSALSQSLFGNTEQRDLCKKVFLAFSYGMNANGIAKLLTGNEQDPARREAIEASVNSFFNRFSRLSQFKSELEARLLRDGRVATPLGNYRARKESGPLKARERRWATSQSIQGTASLIFKTALIEIAKTFGNESILMPMHDAVLMQFPIGEDPSAKIDQVKGIMEGAFSKWCPGVQARITLTGFSEG